MAGAGAETGGGDWRGIMETCFQKPRVTAKTGRQEEKQKASSPVFLRGLPVSLADLALPKP
jgi:hypothetical protein